jgi:hypothetical protein
MKPIINLDEYIGKTVGSRLPPGPEDYDRLVDASSAMMPRLPFPKGVYCFHIHEEADDGRTTTFSRPR